MRQGLGGQGVGPASWRAGPTRNCALAGRICRPAAPAVRRARPPERSTPPNFRGAPEVQALAPTSPKATRRPAIGRPCKAVGPGEQPVPPVAQGPGQGPGARRAAPLKRAALRLDAQSLSQSSETFRAQRRSELTDPEGRNARSEGAARPRRHPAGRAGLRCRRRRRDGRPSAGRPRRSVPANSRYRRLRIRPARVDSRVGPPRSRGRPYALSAQSLSQSSQTVRARKPSATPRGPRSPPAAPRPPRRLPPGRWRRGSRW